MNKISLYTLFIFIYLGLTKSFSISETGTEEVNNRYFLPSLFVDAPTTVILIDYYSAGLFIKTYFHKYRVLKRLNRPKNVIVRVSSDFYKKNLNNIGMSLFRRSEESNEESTVPMPPGTVYLNDYAYGTWVVKDGVKQWNFYRAYSNFPKKLLWGNFRPSKLFFNHLNEYQKENMAFYGNKQEFGTNGSVTLLAKLKPSKVHTNTKINWSEFFNNYLKIPSKKAKKNE